MRKKIQSPFIRSFLHYIPYTVLTAMTVPAIFYAVDVPLAAVAGFVVALILAFLKQGLTVVALAACSAVYAARLLLTYF